MITRPLLASPVGDLGDLKFPILATPKIDGIRVLKINGNAVTRQFKPIPNIHIRTLLEAHLPDNVDGEILTEGGFNAVQSKVMSISGTPDFHFYAFDYVKTELTKPYKQRVLDLDGHFFNNHPPFPTVVLMPEILFTIKEILWYEQKCVDQGFEGIMLRNPFGHYKCGRSTLKEQILLKMKRFCDAEALITGFEEKMQNENAPEKNAFGLQKKSLKKAGMRPSNTLGCLLVKDIQTGIEFGIGSGFDDSLRQMIWNNKNKYLNKIVTYKYQELSSAGVPRFPVFLGMRRDLSK